MSETHVKPGAETPSPREVVSEVGQVTKKPRLTTSAMIASLAAEGQPTRAAPFGHALATLAEARPEIVGLTADLSKYTDCSSSRRPIPIATTRWGWRSSC